jgi:NTP pyrophosphatase (non-canonical NTP hydrolase)
MKKTFIPDASPWVPMSAPIDLMVMGKLAEELSECASAAARCIIQGIDECEPSTGEVNKHWLEKEIADVLANVELACERFGLDHDFIAERNAFKKVYLRKWHSMEGSAYQGETL